MAERSSTSSSDPRRPMGVPWALLLALGLIAVLEIYLHTRDPMTLIAYASDEGQYHALRDIVETQGVAEVALVGSSQMREGVVMSTLQTEVDKRMGRHVWIANYGMRGARADAMHAVVRFLQRQPTPPKLIVVGIGPRDIRALQPDWPRLAILWSPGDWFGAFRHHKRDALDVLPQIIRNVAGRAIYTLRYREEIGLTLKRLFVRFGVAAAENGNPILGQETDAHRGSNGMRSIKDSGRAVHRIIDKATDNYLLNGRRAPPPPLRAALHDLIADFTADPKSGLVIQMPIISYLQDVLDRKGQTREFNKAMATELKKVPMPFVPPAEQTFTPKPEYFVDLQHLNRPGAEAYSLWVAKAIADRLAVR